MADQSSGGDFTRFGSLRERGRFYARHRLVRSNKGAANGFGVFQFVFQRGRGLVTQFR